MEKNKWNIVYCFNKASSMFIAHKDCQVQLSVRMLNFSPNLGVFGWRFFKQKVIQTSNVIPILNETTSKRVMKFQILNERVPIGFLNVLA